MPLLSGKQNIGSNITQLKSDGYSNPKQRIAIALSVARRGKADGGSIDDTPIIDSYTGAVQPSDAAQQKFNRIADTLVSGAKNYIEFPGNAMRNGMSTEDAVNWAAPTALGMVGSPGVPGGAIGSSLRAAKSALPMDDASRMARATEQGYHTSEPVYHETNSQFNEFKPTHGTQVWFTTDKSTLGNNGASGTGNVIEAYLRHQKLAGWPEYEKYTTDQLVSMGYDGARLGSDIVMFSPNGIRTAKARFDPKKINSKNINASVAAGLVAPVANELSKDNDDMQNGGAIRTAKGMAAGGVAPIPFYARNEARNLEHAGMVHSPTGGRSDMVPANVRNGAYVLPADTLSAVGGGNSANGAMAFNKMFKMGPYQSAIPHPTVTRMPSMGMMRGKRGFADGGPADMAEDGGSVPVVVSGGEFVIPREKVTEIGSGSLDHGHDILDRMVKHIRKKAIKTLKRLPGPSRS